MHTSTLDVIIIGGSVAGLSAAQMLGRARRNVLVIDDGAPRNRFASHMHGVLGLDGTPPAELIRRGRDEASGYGVRFRTGRVLSVDEDAGGGAMLVRLEGAEIITARTVLLATGIDDVLPDLPGLRRRWGQTVLHCPYCHGWEVRERPLAVLGTGASSPHQAELLRQWSDDVTFYTDAAGELAADVRSRLAARGVELRPERVVAIEESGSGGDAEGLVVVTAEGARREFTALFAASSLRPRDEAVRGITLERTSEQGVPLLAVDAGGRTSHPLLWAAGNVVAPMLAVPGAMGAGAAAGASINRELVAADGRAAEADRDPEAFWEDRYRGARAVWSGEVNAALAAVVAGLAPGRALDLGCGEGGDALWLADRGWSVTGVDLSASAVMRAEEEASRRGRGDVTFEVRDLDGPLPRVEGGWDLVTAAFLHSPVRLDRLDVLRRAASELAVGGRLVVVSHAAPPPWAPRHGGHLRLRSAAEDAAELALDPAEWIVERAEDRPRAVTAPDGAAAEVLDGIVVVRRLGRTGH
ncbi:FAD-dependent oxidoreductase [Mycetocola reblochoni]|uniref:Thioredoxin reductase n=2 Tax=Mycetocola reblochoni TaxID=331618 RepID=A0A1R4JAP9_9MICO|nr:FAD-dependent oxidoreductase [Mycetocola reblochoni]RLP70028.1 methyltransferase domain-containing protein [Mycetocola reblochoni]SJN29127.1 Thioredoxin reductase [Mycetocola reblochoni REB411]